MSISLDRVPNRSVSCLVDKLQGLCFCPLRWMVLARLGFAAAGRGESQTRYGLLLLREVAEMEIQKCISHKFV